jgi:hypothetical protein
VGRAFRHFLPIRPWRYARRKSPPADVLDRDHLQRLRPRHIAAWQRHQSEPHRQLDEIVHEEDGTGHRGWQPEPANMLLDAPLALEVWHARLSIGSSDRGMDEVGDADSECCIRDGDAAASFNLAALLRTLNEIDAWGALERGSQRGRRRARASRHSVVCSSIAPDSQALPALGWADDPPIPTVRNCGAISEIAKQKRLFTNF